MFLLFNILPCRIKRKVLAKAISRLEDLSWDFCVQADDEEALVKHFHDINQKLDGFLKIKLETDKGIKKVMKEIEFYVKQIRQQKKAILTATKGSKGVFMRPYMSCLIRVSKVDLHAHIQ